MIIEIHFKIKCKEMEERNPLNVNFMHNITAKEIQIILNLVTLHPTFIHNQMYIFCT